MLDERVIREALLYKKLTGKRVKCNTCYRGCVLKDGEVGFCRTRVNRGGRLFTLEYGLISSLSVNPIEKKPLFHFWPGSLCLTMGSWGCTFACPWCQNFEISKVAPNLEYSIVMTPEEFVERTIKEKCQGTSMSFSEPTTFLEFAIDVFKLARKKGLYNTFITNGYFTLEALDALIKAGCDAFNIDIKGDRKAVLKYCKADVELVWQSAIEAKKKGAWVELTTLIIPTVNDDTKVLREIAKRIVDEMGPDTPWHISRYYPAYEFVQPPTPIQTLEKAFDIGKEEGLKYIYIGNVPGHAENTYCPACGELLIERYGFDVTKFNLQKGNRCPKCGEKIPIIGRYIKRERAWLF